MASNDKYPNSQSLILCAIEIYQLHESIKHYLINQENLQNKFGSSELVVVSRGILMKGFFIMVTISYLKDLNYLWLTNHGFVDQVRLFL